MLITLNKSMAIVVIGDFDMDPLRDKTLFCQLKQMMGSYNLCSTDLG